MIMAKWHKHMLGASLGVMAAGFFLQGSSSDARIFGGYIFVAAGFLGLCIHSAVQELKPKNPSEQ
jgi:hypothetical protein